MILCTDLTSDRRELPLALPPGFPRADLVEVARWLDVENSPRYRPDPEPPPAPTDGKPRQPPPPRRTWCNIYAWDVATAWGAVLPHWVDQDYAPARPYHGRELTANGIWQWLTAVGESYGWRRIARADAQAAANTDQLAVAIWRAPLGASGHIALARPGPWREDGPWITQAGARCLASGIYAEGFGSRSADWWACSAR